MQARIAGIAWYREDDYPSVLRIMADGHLLPRTHREWQEKAERAEATAKAQGIRVVRAIIDPQEFPAWCRRHGLNVDAKGRTEFANAEAYRLGRD